MHKAGSNIRAWRTAREMTGTDLANLLERNGASVSPQAVYAWEARGKVARINVMLVLEQLGICKPADWNVPASEAAN